ncbi:MAG: hypothetical protein JKX90_01845 [Colwellia sp.]|nr:hypothetical protein [Colwellia sp.]
MQNSTIHFLNYLIILRLECDSLLGVAVGRRTAAPPLGITAALDIHVSGRGLPLLVGHFIAEMGIGVFGSV